MPKQKELVQLLAGQINLQNQTAGADVTALENFNTELKNRSGVLTTGSG